MPKGQKSTKATDFLSEETIDAIVGAYHGDPFAVLGPHQHGGDVVIRAFLPQASQPSVKSGDGQLFKMQSLHPEGLFEAKIKKKTLPFSYTILFTNRAGERVEIIDPYAFGTTFDPEKTLLYENMGAHLLELNGIRGTRFAVWAPSAERVSVVGNFNHWDGRRHPMRKHHDTGTWEIFIPNVGQGELYKYEIKTAYRGYMVSKSDPVGFYSELRPKNASVVWDIDSYDWQDKGWMENRSTAQSNQAPISIYEVHLGSWKRKQGWEWLTYRDMAAELIPYVKKMGFTHIELLPVAEHPFDGSWGYQVTGYFAPTSRFGTPQAFMYFVDQCHQAGIGVILDWVPAHFPKDQHGLSFFDGTHLYEHADPRQGEHPDWGTLIFNYGRQEVRQFLVDNALFWLDKYHIDGLRVDAVASMLYLDFSRESGEWIPNQYGGRENIEAIAFLREMNDAVHERFPNALTIAEESTSWPGVTHPTAEGGLGFDLKWNMGWMNDTLRYMSNDPIYRAYHQGTLTFSLLYAFSERYALPFSHDEVVHLKKSIVDKMPGDEWRKFANARLLYGYQYAHPGRKFNFMGNEIGQWAEWSESKSLDWHLLDQGSFHKGLQQLFADLNRLYTDTAVLHVADDSWEGFEWLEFRDAQRSILAFLRRAPESDEHVVVVCNFTPEVRTNYRIGVPTAGPYTELLNSDDALYGGSGVHNVDSIETANFAWQEQPYSVQLTLPPLAILFLHPVS